MPNWTVSLVSAAVMAALLIPPSAGLSDGDKLSCGPRQQNESLKQDSMNREAVILTLPENAPYVPSSLWSKDAMRCHTRGHNSRPTLQCLASDCYMADIRVRQRSDVTKVELFRLIQPEMRHENELAPAQIVQK